MINVAARPTRHPGLPRLQSDNATMLHFVVDRGTYRCVGELSLHKRRRVENVVSHGELGFVAPNPITVDIQLEAVHQAAPCRAETLLQQAVDVNGGVRFVAPFQTPS